MISPEFELSSIPNPELSFDYAYATYQTAVDSLKIYYSSDNGLSWVSLLNMAGGVSGPLNTGGVLNTPFVPNASQWATRKISLPNDANKLRFSAVSAYGNNLYLDNISVSDISLSIESLQQTDDFVIVYPNPVQNLLYVNIYVTNASQHAWSIYDINGRVVLGNAHFLEKGNHTISIDLEHLSSGLYFLKSDVAGKNHSVKIVKQ